MSFIDNEYNKFQEFCKSKPLKMEVQNFEEIEIPPKITTHSTNKAIKIITLPIPKIIRQKEIPIIEKPVPVVPEFDTQTADEELENWIKNAKKYQISGRLCSCCTC